jgi:hypothetical protein
VITTFWNYYVLKLLCLETITFSDATLSDINVVLCNVLLQYRWWCFTYILHLSDLFPMLQTKLEELESSSQQLLAAKTALEAELAAERTATESLRTQAVQEAADLAAKLATLTRQGGFPY